MELGRKMLITKVEAILLRPPGPINPDIADGSQDALIVRVHTDAFVVVGVAGTCHLEGLARERLRLLHPSLLDQDEAA